MNQQDIVRFAGDDLLIAFGAHAKAHVFEFNESKQKMIVHGTIDVLGPWGRLFREGNEVLLYSDSRGNATDSGCVIVIGEGKPFKIGELEFPFPVRRILRVDGHIILVGRQGISVYKEGVRISNSKGLLAYFSDYTRSLWVARHREGRRKTR